MKLEEAIVKESQKLISRYHHAQATQRMLRHRFSKAAGIKAGIADRCRPTHWDLSDGFNPFKVRKRAPAIARAIEGAIRDGDYSPNPALVLPISKPSGGVRQISVFPVADAAVASLFFKKLLERNQSRLSPFSYAYRWDISSHDAVERLWREGGYATHCFLVEFDFSKYFDTIRHDYIVSVLKSNFKVTKSEAGVVSAVLRSRRAFGSSGYERRDFRPCVRGIPQGNCLSLFLANVACHELDLSLTRAGVLFARYADDIVVMCDSRKAAQVAREEILRHCESAGLAVNYEKSPGITEFGPQGLREEDCAIRASFEFLGHAFSWREVSRRSSPAKDVVRRLSIRPGTEARVRAKFGRIIYSHLLRYPQAGHFSKTRVDQKIGIDWDLVTCVNDIRGYLYGGLPEDEVRYALVNRRARIHKPEGVMAYFPLVNDVEQMRRLDGWLVNALLSAIELRSTILTRDFGVRSYPRVGKGSLIDGSWYGNSKTKIINDGRIPSFLRAWKYSRRSLSTIVLREFPSRGSDLGDAHYD